MQERFERLVENIRFGKPLERFIGREMELSIVIYQHFQKLSHTLCVLTGRLR